MMGRSGFGGSVNGRGENLEGSPEGRRREQEKVRSEV